MDLLNNESSNDASNLMRSDCFDNEDSNLVSGESQDRCGINDENSNTTNKLFETISGNCYCNKERNLDMAELQCVKCRKWFHESCLTIKLGRWVKFLTTYIFYCKSCSSTKQEYFKRTQTNFSQICQTALANLIHQHSMERIAFSKDREIIPFIEQHFEILANKSKPVKNTWHTSVLKIMQKDSETFLCDNRDPDDILFALRSRDLAKIAPNYEHIIKNFKEQNGGSNANANISSRSLRGVKKRVNQLENASEMIHPNKRLKSELTLPKLPANGFPTEFPFNKDGFKYILAEPDDNAPCRKEFDERSELAGKAIPGFLCRKYMPEKVVLSMNDRAHYLKISEDRKTIIGEKGYSSVRATHGVSRGTWFYEVKINETPSNSATRIGWGQELAQLFAPIGFDKFGYSWRSRKGTAFHESFGKHFADKGFGQGDVIGCLIHLPPLKNTNFEIPLLPKTYKDKPLIKFRSFNYFEEKEKEAKKAALDLVPLEGSKIVYYKNGVKIGTAFQNIYRGTYFPAASLYKNISLTFNFGPNFTHPPTDEWSTSYRAMSDIVLDAFVEQTLADIIYLVENEDKLSLDLFYKGY